MKTEEGKRGSRPHPATERWCDGSIDRQRRACFPTPALFSFEGRITRSDVIAAAADTNEHRINDRIRAREVRLVDPDGRQLGIKPLPDALAIARQLDLDLVEVAPNANPPVCRIMDFGKFKFDEAQRAKESRRKTTSSSIKEMKYRPKIGVGDFDTKTRQVTKFLGEGHKVKITIMFRGREMSHPELGKKLLDQVAEQVGTIAKIEAAPKLDGRNMIMVLAPDRRAAATTQRSGVRPKGSPPTGRGPGESPVPAPPQSDQTNGRARVTPATNAPAVAAPTAPTAPTALAPPPPDDGAAPSPTATPTATPASAPAAASAATPSSTEES